MQEYRYKFYLNAMHSILINGVMGEVHPHTWEIMVDVFKQTNDFMAFTQIEKAVETLLTPFQDKNMNSIPPFDTMNPTLENVSIYLQNTLEPLFVENGFILTRLEVSETPSRSFIIDIAHDNNPRQQAVFEHNIALIEQKADELIQEKVSSLYHHVEQDKVAKVYETKKKSVWERMLKKFKK